MGKQVVSTKTNVNERVDRRNDGSTVKTITTTTIETYDDGSTSTKTNVKTIGGPAANSSGHQHSGGNTAPAPSQSSGNQFCNEALRAHNDYRARHRAPPLTLSGHICNVAQAYANKLAQMDQMVHSKGSGYGENLYMCYGQVPTGKAGVDSWYSEIKDYNWSAGQFTMKTGHFTQVVWKDSKELGVGKATSKSGKTYVVANYSPPGNFAGRFHENVLRG